MKIEKKGNRFRKKLLSVNFLLKFVLVFSNFYLKRIELYLQEKKQEMRQLCIILI